MNAAVGLLTKTGGATSHAAVVARAINTPCVVGCTSLPEDIETLAGKTITIDGSTGNVWVDVDVPVSAGGSIPQLALIASQYNEEGMVTLAGPLTAGGYCTKDTIKNHQIANGGVGLVVDLRSYAPSGDDELEAFFPEPIRQGIDMVYAPKAKFLVPGEAVKDFQNAGYDVLNVTDIEASTLDELLDKKTLKANPALVKKLGVSAFSKLKAVLKQAGFAESSQTVYPAEYILFDKLMEG